MNKFRIVSFDGGGIRGIYTMTLLQRLAEQVPGLLDNVRLYAGTSTGGIIALGLASGLSPAQGVNLYRDMDRRVFQDSWLDDVKDLFTVRGAQYSTQPLRDCLQATFGSMTLQALARQNKYVLIPTFDLDAVKHGLHSWKPKFFHNIPGPDSDGAERLVDVALRTSAAPTYFPTVQGYVDGGVIANNPSMAALAQVLCSFADEAPPADIRLLSLGTGNMPQYIEGDDLDWGYAQWAPRLIPLLLDGSVGVADYQCRSILGETRYFRLAPALPRPIDLDEADKVEDLVSLAQAVNLDTAVAWLQTHFI